MLATVRTARRTRWIGALACLLAGAVLATACAAQASDRSVPTVDPDDAFRPGVEPTVASTEALNAVEFDNVLHAVICWYDDPGNARECVPPGEQTLEALRQIALSGDERFITPLVDMLWLDLGWERWVREALQRLSGQQFATATDWYSWLAQESPPLPEGYAEWKGRLLSLIDTRFRELIHESGGVGPERLVWAHVSSSDFPPLREPATVHRVEERYLDDGDRVIGVVVDGEARAYPERIIAWHGVVRDSVAGRPIVIWHCPSCGGAVAWDARASDGGVYTFGTAGLAYEGRRLVFDEQTRSLWDPLSGRPVHGPLAGSDVALNLVNTAPTSWGEWSARYPNTRVLSLDTGHVRDYEEGAALRLEDASEGPSYPVSVLDDRLEAKHPVLGISINGEQKAYNLARVEVTGMLRDNVGGQDILILGFGEGNGATVYDPGDVVFETFEGTGQDRELVDDEGVRWWADEELLVNQRNGRELPVIPSQVAYWFAWSGTYADTELWDP